METNILVNLTLEITAYSPQVWFEWFFFNQHVVVRGGSWKVHKMFGKGINLKQTTWINTAIEYNFAATHNDCGGALTGPNPIKRAGYIKEQICSHIIVTVSTKQLTLLLTEWDLIKDMGDNSRFDTPYFPLKWPNNITVMFVIGGLSQVWTLWVMYPTSEERFEHR